MPSVARPIRLKTAARTAKARRTAARLVETQPASGKITFVIRSWRKKLLPTPEKPAAA